MSKIKTSESYNKNLNYISHYILSLKLTFVGYFVEHQSSVHSSIPFYSKIKYVVNNLGARYLFTFFSAAFKARILLCNFYIIKQFKACTVLVNYLVSKLQPKSDMEWLHSI